MTYELKHPLRSKNESGQEVELKTIEIQRMKVKHLKHIPDELYSIRESKRKSKTINPVKMLPLLASLTGLTEEQLNEIDIEDFPNLVDKVMLLVGEALDQTA